MEFWTEVAAVMVAILLSDIVKAAFKAAYHKWIYPIDIFNRGIGL